MYRCEGACGVFKAFALKVPKVRAECTLPRRLITPGGSSIVAHYALEAVA